MLKESGRLKKAERRGIARQHGSKGIFEMRMFKWPGSSFFDYYIKPLSWKKRGLLFLAFCLTIFTSVHFMVWSSGAYSEAVKFAVKNPLIVGKLGAINSSWLTVFGSKKIQIRNERGFGYFTIHFDGDKASADIRFSLEYKNYEWAVKTGEMFMSDGTTLNLPSLQPAL